MSNSIKRTLKEAKAILDKGASYTEAQTKARQHVLEALDALVEIVNSAEANDTARIGAASLLIERAFGKAAQTNINANVNADGKAREIDSDELDRRIRETLAQVEGITKRKREKIISPQRPTDLRKLN